MANKNLDELSPNWWKLEGNCRIFAQCFSVHVIGLFVAFRIKKTSGHWCGTGFLYEHRGVPLWITAGHVLKEILELRKKYDIIKAEWMEFHNYGIAVPVDIAGLNPVPIDKDGIDLGVTILRPIYANALKANPKTQFLSEQVWMGKDSAKPEGYYIVGMPCEQHICTRYASGESEGANVKIPIDCLPVEPFPGKPGKEPESFWKCKGSPFFGQLIDPLNSKSTRVLDIKGMSGGPLLSVERAKNNDLKYRLFGVQSSWLPKSRIIRATAIEDVVAIIDALFEALKIKTPAQ